MTPAGLSIIALDPGFATIGFAVLGLVPRPRVTAFGIFRTDKTAKKQNVLAVEDNMRRAIEIARFLRQVVANAPKTVAICAEAMSFPRSASVAAKVALTWGVLASISEDHGIPILQASPQQVKAAVCGAKTASKTDVQDAVAGFYPEIVDLRARIPRGAWEHPHDALAVAHLMLESQVVKMLRLAV